MKIKIEQHEYKELKSLIKNIVGIELGDSKQYLIESRFSPILRIINGRSYSDLIKYLKNRDSDKKIINKIIDAITTHETYFFRDNSPYKTLEKVIKDNSQSSYSIWSAAASTGQEGYSIAMLFEELNSKTNKKYYYKILGTDISQDVINYANIGSYKNYEISRGLSKYYIDKYFIKDINGYKVRDLLKKYISFKTFNLISNGYNLGKFDIIFCRNVLIYFDENTKIKIFQNLYNALNTGGYLFLGSAETPPRTFKKFSKERIEKNVIYKK